LEVPGSSFLFSRLFRISGLGEISSQAIDFAWLIRIQLSRNDLGTFSRPFLSYNTYKSYHILTYSAYKYDRLLTYKTYKYLESLQPPGTPRFQRSVSGPRAGRDRGKKHRYPLLGSNLCLDGGRYERTPVTVGCDKRRSRGVVLGVRVSARTWPDENARSRGAASFARPRMTATGVRTVTSEMRMKQVRWEHPRTRHSQ